MDLIAFHIWMLNDQVRMQAYRKAIFAAVTPGDVVLDVGTGSGIMALFACQAGARLVYAVEAEDIIAVARQLAQENGFSGRIRFIRQDARQLKDLEPVDVIVSELISNNGPGEGMAEVINCCRDRFLRPSGKIIPESVTMLLAPLTDQMAYRNICPPETAAYGLDFAAVLRHGLQLPFRAKVAPEALLAPEKTFYEYQAYRATADDSFAVTHNFTVERLGVLHGYCSWFNATLVKDVVLSNAPPSMLHWDNIFFPLLEPVAVTPGMIITVDFAAVDDGEPLLAWRWSTVVQDGDTTVAAFEQNSRLANPANGMVKLSVQSH